MVRDVLIVTILLVVVAITCMLAFDYFQSPVVTGGPPAQVAVKAKGDYDAKKASDSVITRRPPEVLLFTELKPYAEWYLSRYREPGFLRPPESVDFAKHQVVAVLWGEKPTGGYEVALKSLVDEETVAVVTVATKVPHGAVDPSPISPGVAVVAPRGKRVRVDVTGERFRERNGFTDFKESRSLECEVVVRPDQTPNRPDR